MSKTPFASPQSGPSAHNRTRSSSLASGYRSGSSSPSSASGHQKYRSQKIDNLPSEALRPTSRPVGGKRRFLSKGAKAPLLASQHISKPEGGPERIAKYLARCGVGSRRDVEHMIEAGRVTVNHSVLKTPAFLVSGGEDIVVDGVRITEKPTPRLWRYYKPLGVITTANDPEGRETVFETLPADMPRVLTVGRLDINSEGLLLLTNSGEIARFMEMPSSGMKRCYRARVHGTTTQEKLDILLKGITYEGICYAPATAILERVQGANTWIHITLTEGKNREIRMLMEFLGLQVSRLIRVSYGAFELGKLKEGEACEIPHNMMKKYLPPRLV